MKITKHNVIRFILLSPLIVLVGGFWLLLQGVKWYLIFLLVVGPAIYAVMSWGDMWLAGLFLTPGLILMMALSGGSGGVSQSDYDAVCQQRDAARAHNRW